MYMVFSCVFLIGVAGAWRFNVSKHQLRKQLGAIFDRLKTQILKRTDQLRDFVEEAAQSKAPLWAVRELLRIGMDLLALRINDNVKWRTKNSFCKREKRFRTIFQAPGISQFSKNKLCFLKNYLYLNDVWKTTSG